MQLGLPWVKVSTDAGGHDPAQAEAIGPVHPRGYGTYPRVLGHYVREVGALSLEEAVRKMSSAVADRLGLRERGLLRVGCCADVVAFDPETVGESGDLCGTAPAFGGGARGVGQWDAGGRRWRAHRGATGPGGARPGLADGQCLRAELT